MTMTAGGSTLRRLASRSMTDDLSTDDPAAVDTAAGLGQRQPGAVAELEHAVGGPRVELCEGPLATLAWQQPRCKPVRP
jgi:hypothetical protein